MVLTTVVGGGGGLSRAAVSQVLLNRGQALTGSAPVTPRVLCGYYQLSGLRLVSKLSLGTHYGLIRRSVCVLHFGSYIYRTGVCCGGVVVMGCTFCR